VKSHQEAYFMGRIAASTTHGLKNILAVISETLGLLEDLASAPSRTASLDESLDKVKKSAAIVSVQVAKGIALVEDYNRFAHILDHPVQKIDLRDSIHHLIKLCAHMIRLKQVKVEQQIPESKMDVHLTTCPFYLYMVVFEILDRLMTQMSPGSFIKLQLEKDGDTAMICFSIASPEDKSEFGINIQQLVPAVEPFLKALEAEFTFDEKEKALRLTLRDLNPDKFAFC